MQAASSASLAAAAVLLTAVVGYSTTHANTSPARPAFVSGYERQELPDGPGKDEVKKLCAGCHDLTFTISTRETEEGWTKVVNDMRSKGADGSDADFEKVIAYLTANMGKK